MKLWGPNARGSSLHSRTWVWLSLSILLACSPVLGQPAQTPVFTKAGIGLQSASTAAAPAGPGQSDQQPLGSVSGTVLDPSGAAIVGARVTLARGNPPSSQDVPSGDGGQFSFSNVAAGPFHITITAAGFGTQILSGNLGPGQAYDFGKITLPVAASVTQVRVSPAIAEQQIKEQEKQRVLGVFPNFYVSYIPNPVPLSPRQKFELAWKTMTDPVTLMLTGAVAGVEQEDDSLSGYGQGAQGYGKRFGAFYADSAASTFIGGVLLSSLLKQDPRYFYKGTGSVKSRFLYAIANAVICKGDNGHWQANYSGILGNLAAGGLADLYYPSTNRNGAALVFETGLTEIGESAAANVLEEFVVRKLTRNAFHQRPVKFGASPATANPKPDVP